MPELNSSAVELFIETVQSGAQEAASAYARTFDKEITIKAGVGESLHLDSFMPKVVGEGLVLLLKISDQGVAIILPKSTGLVPDWCAHPDVTEKSKLATFAQEWGMNLIPEDFFPDDYQAALLRDVDKGLIRGQPGLDAGYLELNVSVGGGAPIPIYMVWPFGAPDQLLDEPKTEEAVDLPPPPTFGGSDEPLVAGVGPGFDPFGDQAFVGTPSKRISLDDLPGYSRSVLKVRVPVAAVLATARKPIKSILELGVGSVIQFDKSCDELLDVEIGQSVVIGQAEAVKVGDKFGFRIHSILLPEERFRKVEVRHEGEYRVKHDSPQIIGKAPIKSFDSH